MARLNRSKRRRYLATLVMAAWGGVALAAAHGCAGNATTNTGGGTGSSGAGSSGSGASSGTQTASGSSAGASVSGTGGSSGTSGASGASGTSGTAGTAGASGAAGATDAGAAPSCVTAVSPSLITFDAYNPLSTAGFDTFFGSGANIGYIGPYAYSGGSADGGVDWVINPVTGRTGGTIDGGMDWAMDFVVTQEAQYGATLGLFISCVNATAYKGITFWTRGQTPIGTCSEDAGGGSCFTLSLITSSTEAAGDAGVPGCAGTCADPLATDLPLSANWSQVQVPWADFGGGFVDGTPYTPTGAGIVGLQFHMSLTYPGVDAGEAGIIYPPQPASFDFQIDDIGFIQ